MREPFADAVDLDGWERPSDQPEEDVYELFHDDRGLRAVVDDEVEGDQARLRVTELVQADDYRASITRRQTSVRTREDITEELAAIDPDDDLYGLTVAGSGPAGLVDILCTTDAEVAQELDTGTAETITDHAYGESDVTEYVEDAQTVEEPAEYEPLPLHLLTVTEDELVEI